MISYSRFLDSGDFEFKAIGVVKTPFRDKFGVPRQPGLALAARGVVKLNDDPDLRTALRSIETFSHLWIVFVFHEHGGRNWKPSIRPPRLGGVEKVGVLASRSPHRPNPIGMSAVVIERIDFDAVGGVEIFVSGVDLIDGTPVLDLKPYIPYADSLPNASAGWASAPIERFHVAYSPEAETYLRSAAPDLRAMITDVLELDPRPAYQKRQLPVSSENLGKVFGLALHSHEVKYEIAQETDGVTGFLVTSVSSIQSTPT